MNTKKLLAGLTVAASLVLAACGAQAGSQSATSGESPSNSSQVLTNVQNKKKLVVGTSADYPPFEWHLVKDGKDSIVGIDVDIANEIASSLGVEVEIKEMEFNSLVAAVKSGKVDLVLAGMNPTEERAKEVDFSKVYYDTQMVAVVKKSDVANYGSMDALNGKKLGAQKGSAQEGIIQDQFPTATLTSQPKNPTLILALQQGKLDAVIMDNIVADEFVKSNDDLTVAPFTIPAEDLGAAAVVQKGNNEYLAKIQAVLDELNANGKMKEFILKNTELMSE